MKNKIRLYTIAAMLFICSFIFSMKTVTDIKVYENHIILIHNDNTCTIRKMENENLEYEFTINFLVDIVKEVDTNKNFIILKHAKKSSYFLCNREKNKIYPLGANHHFDLSPNGTFFYNHITQELTNLDTQQIISKSNFHIKPDEEIKVYFSPDEHFVILAKKTSHGLKKYYAPTIINLKTGKKIKIKIKIESHFIEKLTLLPYGKIVYYIPGEDLTFRKRSGFYRIIDINNQDDFNMLSCTLSIDKKSMAVIDFKYNPLLINIESNKKIKLSKNYLPPYCEDIGSQSNKKSTLFLSLLEYYSEKKEFDIITKYNVKKFAVLINLQNYKMLKTFDITDCQYTYNVDQTKFLFQDNKEKDTANLICLEKPLDKGEKVNISKFTNIKQFLAIPNSSYFLAKTKEGKIEIIK